MEQDSLRVPGLFQRGRAIQIDVDGDSITAFEGETIAAALTAAGKRRLGFSHKGNPRGVFCGMGACFECTVEIDGGISVRSCVTPVRSGMRVSTRGRLMS